MAIDCIDINLDETPEGNSGDWWDQPLGWRGWLSAFNSREGRDTILLCCDAGYVRDRFVYETTYTLTASGSPGSIMYFACGLIGSRYEPSPSQNAWWFVGSRPDPMRRQQYRGKKLFKIFSDFIHIEGIKARNFDEVMEFPNSLQDSAVINCIFQNASFGMRFRGPVRDVFIDQIVGRNVTKSVMIFHDTVEDTTISNIVAINTNIEDGEAIGIRLLGKNNNNVRIRDVTIGSQYDHYIGAVPKNPYYKGPDYKAYTQGEALAIEGGTGIEIDRFFVFNTTDRLIDCKAQCIIRNSGGTASKRGITMWAADSHAINCVVKSSIGVGNTPATAYLLFGEGSSLVDCSAIMLPRRFKATIIVSQGISIKIERGEYIQPEGRPFLLSGSSVYSPDPTFVELVNVNINGRIYNETVRFDNNAEEWIPY